MKPTNWASLGAKAQRQYALDFLASQRGMLIVSQALYYAMEVLKSAPMGEREESNIEDMALLRESVFPLFHNDKVSPRLRTISMADIVDR